jgi:hypothetical protein
VGIKLERLANHNPNNSSTTYLFHCPGCQAPHPFEVPRWIWNSSLTEPTFMPSLLVNRHDPQTRCHLFMARGQIQFLTDCHHSLAGQTVPCPDWQSSLQADKPEETT